MIRGADGALCYLSGCNHEVFNTNRKRPGVAAWGGCAMPRDASGLLKRPCELKGYGEPDNARKRARRNGRPLHLLWTPPDGWLDAVRESDDRHIHQSGVVIRGARSLWPEIRSDQRSTSCRFCCFAALITPNKPYGPRLATNYLRNKRISITATPNKTLDPPIPLSLEPYHGFSNKNSSPTLIAWKLPSL